jgi:endogenous inhibitor of DNA gyrase (YacG/DUF329 family)
MKRKCPVCHKTVKGSVQKQNEEAEIFPFCSQRCKLVDLAGWLDGRYKIISKLQSQESDKPPEDSSGNTSREQ